jgi:hypothetical protein
MRQVLSDTLFWQPGTPAYGKDGLTYRKQLEEDYMGGLACKGTDSYRRVYVYSDSADKVDKIEAAMSNEKEWIAITSARVEGIGKTEWERIETRRQFARRNKK